MGPSSRAGGPSKDGEEAGGKRRRDRRWVESLMAFANPSYVFPDHQRGGVGNRLILPRKRGPTHEKWDLQKIRIRDLARFQGRSPDGFEPDLFKNGFAVAELSAVLGLQQVLQGIARRDTIGLPEVSALAQSITKKPIPLGAGHTLEVLEVDYASLFMRRSGPDAMSLDATGGKREVPKASARTLAAAVNAHTDGDVDSEKRQAGWKRRFNHSGNPSSELFVLNIWIALQQPVRPLAVMDTATLDRESDQVKLAYELPARTDDEFLNPLDQQEPKTAENHCILHRPSQEWYFKSDLGPGEALVFDTMSTPHGTFLLPGEGELGQLYRQLERAREVLTEGGEQAQVSIGALTFALWPDSQQQSPLCPEAGATPMTMRLSLPLRPLLLEMDGLVQEGREDAASLCRAPTDKELQAGVLSARADYLRRVSSALGRCSRKSVEIRCSALVRSNRFASSFDVSAFKSWLRLPSSIDPLGIVEALAAFRIPGSRLHGWVVFLAAYLFCALMLILPPRTFVIS